MKIQITSWCDNSVLFEADCDTLKLAIGKAVTANANLHDADLHGANLHDADLHGANVIDAGHSRNGYRFAGIKQEAGYKVKGGCHFFTPKEALEYWSGKQDRLEALAACTYIAAVAKIRGWV
jgi:hypothetical protein